MNRLVKLTAAVTFLFVTYSNVANAAPKGPSIVDIALGVNAETGEFSTLIAALGAADLVETLNANRHFTVFAPLDSAFAELGLTAANVGDVPNLSDILLYHVAPGDRFSDDLFPSARVRMMNKDFAFTSLNEEGAPFINDAAIVPGLFDLDARNGVVHVIDQVLLPPVKMSASSVPEPSGMILAGLGVGMLLVRRRSNR